MDLDLVLFVDMDYFFAACEELRHPEYKDKPLVVGTASIKNKEKGVVQTCNYVARKYGIRSAMSTANALKLKPDLIYLESDDRYYSDTSSKVMEALRKYGSKMEIVSIDEAALELNNVDYESGRAIADKVKSEINERLKLPCTIGISTSKIYAKMVCDTAKPNGIGLLKAEEIKDFLREKDVDKLLGVGRKTAEKLNGMKIKTIGELSKADPIVLIDNFGIFGKELFLLANGIDNSKIEESYDILSIGRERALDATSNIKVIEPLMSSLVKEIMEEVRKNRVVFKTISVKARYADFTDHIKNRSLNHYSDSEDVLYSNSISLIKELARGNRVRKIGVRVSKLMGQKGQKKLF